MTHSNPVVRKYVLASEQRSRPEGAKSKSRPVVCRVYTVQDYNTLETTLQRELRINDRGQGDVARRILSNEDRREEHGVLRAYLRVWSCNRSEAIKHLNKICPNSEYREHE